MPMVLLALIELLSESSVMGVTTSLYISTYKDMMHTVVEHYTIDNTVLPYVLSFLLYPRLTVKCK